MGAIKKEIKGSNEAAVSQAHQEKIRAKLRDRLRLRRPEVTMKVLTIRRMAGLIVVVVGVVMLLACSDSRQDDPVLQENRSRVE